MSEALNELRITSGMKVRTADGDDLGSVSSIEGRYVVATKGLIFTNTTYVPTSTINAGDDTTLYLDVTAEQVKASGWDEVPTDFHEDATVPGTATGDALEEAANHIPADRSTTAAMRDDDRHHDPVRP